MSPMPRPQKLCPIQFQGIIGFCGAMATSVLLRPSSVICWCAAEKQRSLEVTSNRNVQVISCSNFWD